MFLYTAAGRASPLVKIICRHNRFSSQTLVVEVFVQADAQEGAADVSHIIKAVALKAACRVVGPLA